MPFKCERAFFKVARRSFRVVCSRDFYASVVVKNDFFLSIEKRAMLVKRRRRERKRKKKSDKL